MDTDHAQRVEQAVTVVAAYVSQHHVPVADLPGLLASVHGAIGNLGKSPDEVDGVGKPTREQIDASVRRDGLVSFIDGQPYQTLKRHLAKHGLTPDAYRDRFGLPSTYPMTALAYSERRSALAKSIGLGKPGHLRSVA